MATQKFHIRSFISFSLLISIIWILVSGTILYIAPPGRVAHWQHWTIFGFDKNQWQAQHTIFSYIFVIILAIHIFSLNWRNLWSYVKIKSKKGFRKKDEFIFAFAISLLIFFGTSYDIPPFSSFFQFGEYIGTSWEEKQQRAPVPHTENLTLDEVSSKYLETNVEDLISKLESNGILVTGKSQTFEEIAIQNGISPSDVYAVLNPNNSNKPGNGGSGTGYGRMAIKEVATNLGIEFDEILLVLKSNGIDASPNNSIKDISSDHGLHLSEIMKMIKGDH
jgi:hypothetical protein